jgi:hypothetical protein
MSTQNLHVEITGDSSDFVKATDKAAEGLGRFVDKQGRLREANGQFVRINDKAGESLGRLGSAFSISGKQMEKYGKALTLAISAPLALLGKSAITAYGEMDALTRGLATLEKDAGTLQNRLNTLLEVAKLPGLGYKEAIQFDVALRSAGFSAEMSKRTMIAFGNALGSIGKGKNELKGVSVQLQQLSTKTGGYGADLRIIKEYAPQVGNALQAAFGTVDTEKIAALGFTGAQVVEKIVAELEKLPKATGGINQAFENFGDTLFRTLSGIGQALDNSLGISPLISKVGDSLVWLAEKFGSLSPASQTLVAGIGLVAIALPPVIAAVGFFATSVLPALSAGLSVAGVAFTALTGPIGLIAGGVAVAGALIYFHWDKIKSFLSDLGFLDYLKQAFKSTLGIISSIFAAFANLLQGDWSSMWDHIANVGKFFANLFVQSIASAIRTVGGLISKALSLLDAKYWSKTVADGMKAVQETANKFKFETPKSANNLFKGFNFGGDKAGQKPKEEVKSEYDKLTARAEALKKQIEELGAANKAIPKGLQAEYDGVLKKLAEIDKLTSKSRGKDKKAASPGESTFDFNNRMQKYVEAGWSERAKIGKVDAIGPRENGLSLIGYGGSSDKRFAKDFDTIKKNFEKLQEELRKQTEKTREPLERLKDDISQALSNAAGAALVGMGELIGGLLTGVSSLADLPRMFGNILGQLAKDIGKSMIAFGTAGIALKALSISPAGAIAAGVGLTTLGTALQASVAKQTQRLPAFANEGGAWGPTLAAIGDHKNPRVNPEYVLKKDTVMDTIDRAIAAGRGGGRGVTVVNKFRNGTIRSASAYENETIKNFV